MKKKVFIAVVGIVMVSGAFSLGRMSVPKQTQSKVIVEKKENDFNDFCDMAKDIVDWNTDGKELSFTTADGYEFYSYRSQDIYKHRNFVPVERN